MKINTLHPWDVSETEAIRIQEELSSQVRLLDSFAFSEIHYIAGIDNAYQRSNIQEITCAGIVVMSYPELHVVERRAAVWPVKFPYIPGLLAFRELPAILTACQKITSKPDIILYDAQGYAHFRRIGAASHLGLILDCPTIGCAKTCLLGEYNEPGQEFGASTPLVDRSNNTVVGSATRTCPDHTPLFISPGYKISLLSAVKITLDCCQNNNFLPEPIRLAHHWSNDALNGMNR